MTETTTPAMSTPRPHIGRIGGALATAGVLALGSAGCGGPASVDRNDAGQTAAAFTTATASGDGAACALATPKQRASLQQQNRCNSSPNGPTPQVTVLFAKDCGDKSLAGMEANPPGSLGGHYALVGLQRGGEGWSVQSLTPMNDRAAVQPGECG